MELTMDQVQAAALTLSESDRVQLADKLYGSIGEGPSAREDRVAFGGTPEHFLANRWNELESGSVAGISEEEVHAELDALVDG